MNMPGFNCGGESRGRGGHQLTEIKIIFMVASPTIRILKEKRER